MAERKKKITEAIDIAAARLGNTQTVCRKYYVHPAVIDHYTNKTIEKYFKKISDPNGDSGLTPIEQIPLKMRADAGDTAIVP